MGNPIGIKIIGPAQNINCFGSFTREIAFALLSMGENVCLHDTTGQGDFPAKLSEEDNQKINVLKAVNMSKPYIAIHINAPEKFNFVDTNANANIAWTALETLSLPLLSSIILSNPLFKEIWVPAGQKMIFDNVEALAKKTQAVQFGINTDKFNPNNIKNAKELVQFRSDDNFYFGFIGSLKNTSGFDLVLKAFYEEFSNEPKAKLAFKVFMGTLQPQQEKEAISGVIRQFKKDSQAEVLYISGNQDDSFMTVQHHAIDCLVSPARGKVWNNSVIKCMAAGIPTIVNTHAGNKSYTGKETNYLLTSSKNTLITNLDWMFQNLIYQGSSWSEPNLEELKKTMRIAFNNRNDSKEMTDKARTRVEKLDWKNIAMEIVKKFS